MTTEALDIDKLLEESLEAKIKEKKSALPSA